MCREDKGQTMVELAIVLPVVVLLVFGMLEIGRVLNSWVIVTQASREGARTAAVQCARDPGCEAVVDDRVNAALTGLPVADVSHTLSAGPYVSGDPVTVRVEYTVPLVTPLISAFFPTGAKVTGETEMRLE